MSLAYREAQERDYPLIVASWVDSYRTAHVAGMIAMQDWRVVMTPQVLQVLARPGARTFVAYHPGETDPRSDLYGWICVEHDATQPVHGGRMEPIGCPLVHYVYVRLPYRRSGIGTGLFGAAGVDPRERFLFTCKTALASQLQKQIAPRSLWAPLIARHPKTQTQELTVETLPSRPRNVSPDVPGAHSR